MSESKHLSESSDALVKKLNVHKHLFFLFLRRFIKDQIREWISSVSGVSIDRIRMESVFTGGGLSKSFWGVPDQVLRP